MKKIMPNLIFTLFVSHVKAMRFEDAAKLLDEYRLSKKQKGLYDNFLKTTTNEAKN